MDIVDTVKGLQNVVRLVARETDVHSHQQGSLHHTISAIWPSIASRLQTVHVEALPYASSSVLCQDASLSNLEELKVSVCATSYGFVPAHAEGASYLPADLASFISAASTTLTTLHLSIPEQASVPDTGYDALFGTLVARSLPRLRNLHLCLAVIHGHSRTGLEGWLLALAPQLEHFSLLAQDCWRTSFSAVDYFALLAHIVPAMARLEHLGLAYPHKTAYYTTPDSHEAALAISGLLQTFRWAMSVGIQVVSISGRAFDLDDLHDALRFDQSRHSVCGTETPPIEQGCSDEQLHGILTTRFSRLIVEPKDAQPSDTVFRFHLASKGRVSYVCLLGLWSLRRASSVDVPVDPPISFSEAHLLGEGCATQRPRCDGNLLCAMNDAERRVPVPMVGNSTWTLLWKMPLQHSMVPALATSTWNHELGLTLLP
jgi:hypothetical protein